MLYPDDTLAGGKPLYPAVMIGLFTALFLKSSASPGGPPPQAELCRSPPLFSAGRSRS